MADEWYYTIQGQQMGPVSTAELRQLAAQQRLQPTDLVWKEGMPKWVPAANTQGLFASAAPARAEPLASSALPPADYDDRPRRRRRDPDDRDEVDDYEERPRRRRRARSGGGMSTGVVLLIVGGVALLCLVGVGVLVLIIVAANRPASGPGTYTVDLGPGQADTRLIHFNQGQMVEIRVNSDFNTDVDLFVEDQRGFRVAFDDRISSDCFVRFSAPVTGNYRVTVVNLGRIRNTSHVRHN
jgi:hypothetical protein